MQRFRSHRTVDSVSLSPVTQPSFSKDELRDAAQPSPRLVPLPASPQPSPSFYHVPNGALGSGAPTPTLSVAPTAPSPQLSLWANLLLNARFFLRGVSDSLRPSAVLAGIESDPRVRAGLLKSTLFQGLVIASELGWEQAVARGMRGYLAVPRRGRGRRSGAGHMRAAREAAARWERWGFWYRLFWLYPLLLGSFYLSGLFNLHVAERRFETDRRGRLAGGYKAVTMKLLSESYRLLLALTYFGVVQLLRRIPDTEYTSFDVPLEWAGIGDVHVTLGGVLAGAYASVVDGYYVFEYSWIAKGWNFSTRAGYLHARPFYFLGFGLISTFLSLLPASPVLSISIFSFLFPFLLLLVPAARPVPLSPDYPSLPPQRKATRKENARRGHNRFESLSTALPGDSISLQHYEEGAPGASADYGSGGDGAPRRRNRLVPAYFPAIQPAVWGYAALWRAFTNEGMRSAAAASGGSAADMAKRHSGGVRSSMRPGAEKDVLFDFARNGPATPTAGSTPSSPFVPRGYGPSQPGTPQLRVQPPPSPVGLGIDEGARMRKRD